MNAKLFGDFLIFVNICLLIMGIVVEAKLSLCDKKFKTPFWKYRIERVALLIVSLLIFIYSLYSHTIPEFNPMRLAYFFVLAYINIRGVYELKSR